LYEVSPGNPEQQGIFYHAAVSLQPADDIPSGACWVHVDTLTRDSFARSADFLAIERFESALTAGDPAARPEPFRNPNWFLHVTAWVSKSLRRRGLELSGPFEQFNASPTFSLIRFETSGRPVWFKAVGEPNFREFRITLVLSRTCPEYLPKVLADHAEWNAWIAEEAAGIPLSAAEFRDWARAAETLARLQIRALPHAHELSAAGARDLRPGELLSQVVPFCEFISNSARRPDAVEAWPAGNGNWHELGRAIEDALCQLDRAQLPPTLGHMDLNPENIFCSSGACVFLDWAEGFTGCPFFAFEYLLQHFRRRFRAHPASEMQLRERYLRPWQRLLAKCNLESVLTFSPLAALFAYASTRFTSLMQEGSAVAAEETYLVRLARRMYRMTAQEKGSSVERKARQPPRPSGSNRYFYGFYGRSRDRRRRVPTPWDPCLRPHRRRLGNERGTRVRI
jgi:hypothetical protein